MDKIEFQFGLYNIYRNFDADSLFQVNFDEIVRNSILNEDEEGTGKIAFAAN